METDRLAAIAETYRPVAALPASTMTKREADVLWLIEEVRRLRDGILEHQSAHESISRDPYGRSAQKMVEEMLDASIDLWSLLPTDPEPDL